MQEKRSLLVDKNLGKMLSNIFETFNFFFLVFFPLPFFLLPLELELELELE